MMEVVGYASSCVGDRRCEVVGEDPSLRDPALGSFLFENKPKWNLVATDSCNLYSEGTKKCIKFR